MDDAEFQRRMALTNRVCGLRVVTADDYPYLYNLEVGGEAASSWRFRGSTPSPEQHRRSLWDGVLATFVIEVRDKPQPVGLVAAYGADLWNGHVSVGVNVDTVYRDSGVAIGALVLLVEYCFREWNLQKVYFETVNPDVIALVDRPVASLLVEEARLREDSYRDGRYIDKVVMAIHKEDWERESPRFAPFLALPMRNAG